ncbi:MAG: hypothetical protein HUK03_06210, partial [Bacteroidaceae bacterium]|nr:hypothetical protein [Bacteroidaceae bacterium]
DNHYGPMAQTARIDSAVTIHFRTYNAESFPHAQTFQRIRVRARGSGSIAFITGGKRMELTCADASPEHATDLYQVTLSSPVRGGAVVIDGAMSVQAIQLDGTSGVVMDNVAMRGSSGNVFTSISRGSLQPFFRSENVRLIILQYGGNSVPYLRKDEDVATFCEGIRRQIALFRELAPQAKILFIGPSDMATLVKGDMTTYPILPTLNTALRQAAGEEGAAYWSMYEAMGGKGTMVRWVKNSPPLACEDYVHFTPKGAARISEVLYETFNLYYNYYKFRRYGRYHIADSLALAADSL